jgi:hypothetical protein
METGRTKRQIKIPLWLVMKSAKNFILRQKIRHSQFGNVLKKICFIVLIIEDTYYYVIIRVVFQLTQTDDPWM